MPITCTALSWGYRDLIPRSLTAITTPRWKQVLYLVRKQVRAGQEPADTSSGSSLPATSHLTTSHTTSKAKYYCSFSNILSTRSKHSCPMDAVIAVVAAAFCLSQSRVPRSCAGPCCCPQEGTNVRLSQQQQDHRFFWDESLKFFSGLLIVEQWKNSKTEWKMETNVATAQLAGPQSWVLHGKTAMVKTSINK